MSKTMTSATHTNSAADQMAAFRHGAQPDYWMRTVGVPWEELSQAVRAVSDRAAASFFRQLDDTPPSEGSTRQ